jgi:polysaccharide export outer membrane protein
VENIPAENSTLSKESPEIQPIARNVDDKAGRSRTDYRIQGKDILYIDVYNEPELSYDLQKQRSLRVSTDGKISFPLIGDIEVAGLTPFQLERKLEELLGDGYLINPHVSVMVGSYHGSVCVIGQVRSPGEIKLQDREITVVEAISMKGGFTDIASPNRTYIIRMENGVKKIIQVKVNKIIKSKKGEDIILKPSDTVVIPEAFF